jgi:RNA polymerase sigma-70 factor (ECF subfamily)
VDGGRAGFVEFVMTDWEHLLAEHGPALHRTAQRILGSAPEAEDCVQEVMLEVVAGREPSQAVDWPAFLRWLTAVRSLDRLRRRRRRRETALDPLTPTPTGDPGPHAALETAERRAWLRSSLTRLSALQADVVAMRYFAGMSYEEIASATGRSSGAVGTALHAARAQLRAMVPTEWIEQRTLRDDHAAL